MCLSIDLSSICVLNLQNVNHVLYIFTMYCIFLSNEPITSERSRGLFSCGSEGNIYVVHTNMYSRQVRRDNIYYDRMHFLL